MRNKFGHIVVLLFIAVVTNTPASQKFKVNEKDRERLMSLAPRICHNTIQKSDQKSFYIADFNSDPSVSDLIQTLHRSSIPTVSTDHYCKLMDTTEKIPFRNFIFYLDNLEEITSLVLSTASTENTCQRNLNFDEIKYANTSISAFRDLKESGIRKMRKLPRYCIKVDRNFQSLMDTNCYEQMYISTEELDGSSELSDVNFNMTRSLYTHPIWNSKNYLIFMINEFDWGVCTSATSTLPAEWHCNLDVGNKTTPNLYGALLLRFKFIWRFFRGLKASICHREGCSRYDPFAEKIFWYNGAEDEAYFDFSVTNMHKKRLMFMSDFDGAILGQSLSDYWEWLGNIKMGTVDELAKSLNFTPFYDLSPCDLRYGIGQQRNTDLHYVNIGATPKDVDYSRFEFTVGVETVAICILAPHSKFMPQCLVPFKVFTFDVWICIILTCSVFVFMQYTFLNSQRRTFRGLYSTSDISMYDSSSSIHTIYAYFICGSPPRLMLGKLFTGKILFSVFIFSALIITNVFLGGMTTLLTSKVQYPEIDTLQDLENSDLFIQVPERESAAVNFAKLGFSEKLISRLSSTLENYITTISQTVGLWDFDFERNTMVLMPEVAGNFAHNLPATMENDAFLVAFPPALSSENRFVLILEPYTREKFEFHLVKECLKADPCVFSFLKNSFLFDAFNRKITQFLETGHVSKTVHLKHSYGRLEAVQPSMGDEEPRPYSLNDLQLPFFSLFLGLVLSFLVFIAEMVIEDFENAVVFRQLRRLKNYLLC